MLPPTQQEGGYLDFTCRSLKARLALKKFDQEAVLMDRVMVSSDSYGSLPTFDEEGNLIKYTYGNTKAFLQFIFKMYFQEMWSMVRLPRFESTAVCYSRTMFHRMTKVHLSKCAGKDIAIDHQQPRFFSQAQGQGEDRSRR